MGISLAKIEKLLEPTKERSQSVSWFIGTVLGVNGSQLVVEMKSGDAVYVQNFAYCNVGDEVLCMSNGTSIVAVSTRNAQAIADDLDKIGLVYSAGDGITIDENNKINANVTEADIQQLSTEISSKASASHAHSAADTASGVFDLARIPTIPATKLSGTIPGSMLPSYVDDVLEYASRSAFPATGEDGKIYVDESTNKTYRWGGSSYVEISASLALGETSSTAYPGDRGKQAYDHISRTDNPHGVTCQQVGAAAEDHAHTAAEVGAAALSHTHPISNITNLQTTLNGKANASHAHSIANVTGLQDALDGKSNTNHTHTLGSLGVTATAAEINKLDGVAATTAELNFMSGVTSNVQTQLNAKAAANHAHTLNGSSIASPSWYAPRSAGRAGQYLTSSGSGEPVWADIEGGVVFQPNGYPDDSVCLACDPGFNPADEFGGTWTKETATHLFLGITIWRCVATPNRYFSPLDMHPIGTAFMTYDKAHNPAAEFGGTWTLEESTYMFMGIKIYRRVA